MENTMMLFVVLICLIGILSVLISCARKQKQKLKKQMKDFSERASVYGIVFTGQELFSDCLLGLDGINRHLLILDSSVHPAKETYIDLLKVRRCIANHHFKRCYENNTDHIIPIDHCSLEFEFFDGSKLEVVFQHQQDLKTLREMSIKTRKWAAVISKIVSVENGNSADASG